MAFQPVPDTAQVEIRMTLYGQQVENVLHFYKAGGADQADLDDLTEAIGLWWYTTYANVLGNEVTQREIYARMLDTAIDIQSTDIVYIGYPGVAGTPSAPGNVTFAVSFRSGFTGRSARGRAFIPGIPEAVITGNSVSSTYGNSAVAAFVSLGAVVAALGWVHVVVSRQQNGAVLPVGLKYQVFDYAYTDLHVDSQRRRLTGRGA